MTETIVQPDVPRWQALPPDTIAWTEWDADHYIAYHRPSGITHYLNAASAALITEILTDAADAKAVAKAFEPAMGGTDWGEHLAEITATLEHLEILGLVRRV